MSRLKRIHTYDPGVAAQGHPVVDPRGGADRRGSAAHPVDEDSVCDGQDRLPVTASNSYDSGTADPLDCVEVVVLADDIHPVGRSHCRYP